MALKNSNPATAGGGAGQIGEKGNSAFTLKSAKKKAKRETTNAVLVLLAERWPACFSIYQGRRKPLKIGIHNDILAAMAGAITPYELTVALACYTANYGYLKTVAKGRAKRIDLNGAVAGVITPDEALHAKFRLLELYNPARRRPRCNPRPGARQ